MENHDPAQKNKVEIVLKESTINALNYLLSLIKRITKNP